MSERDPFTFINVFEIAPEAIDPFCEQWVDRSRFMRTAAGFVDATLFRAQGADARFQLVNVSNWASHEAFEAATANPDYKAELDQLFADLEGKLVANRGRYNVVARFEHTEDES